MSSPGLPPRQPSIKKREGAVSGRFWTKRSRLGSMPASRRAQAVSVSRSGLWTRQKLPPHRSSQAAAVWLGMRGSNSHGRSQSPLHYHYANPHRVCVLGVCPQRSYIIACPTGFVNAFFEKTSIFSPKFSVFQNSSLLRQSFSVIRCRWISLTAGGTFIPWVDTACPTRCTP